MKDRVQLFGHTFIAVRDPQQRIIRVVKDEHNSIGSGLRTYFMNSMDSNVDNAINSLFTGVESDTGGPENGNDGICAYNDQGTYYSMVTTTATPTETYGKKWHGSWVATADGFTVNWAYLGHNYNTSNEPFDPIFAQQNFSAVTLDTNYELIIDWEIYIQ